jgi:hypothetical protein
MRGLRSAILPLVATARDSASDLFAAEIGFRK